MSINILAIEFLIVHQYQCIFISKGFYAVRAEPIDQTVGCRQNWCHLELQSVKKHRTRTVFLDRWRGIDNVRRAARRPTTASARLGQRWTNERLTGTTRYRYFEAADALSAAYGDKVPARRGRRWTNGEMSDRLNVAGSPRTAVGGRARVENDE